MVTLIIISLSGRGPKNNFITNSDNYGQES